MRAASNALVLQGLWLPGHERRANWATTWGEVQTLFWKVQRRNPGGWGSTEHQNRHWSGSSWLQSKCAPNVLSITETKECETVKKIGQSGGQDGRKWSCSRAEDWWKDVEHCANEHLRSLREEKRKNQLILFNIKESDKDEAEGRKAEDTNKVNRILEFMNALSEYVVITRMGPKGVTPRPVKIMLKNQADQTKILKAAKNLKGTEIYINKDMTPLEQAEHNKLVMELKRRREDVQLNEQWVIRWNRVINAAIVEQEQEVDHGETSQDSSLDSQ